MALDPLAAVEKAAQRPYLRIDVDVEERLERVDRAHLVGDRADAADARDDVDDLVWRAANDQSLEVAGCLEDAQVSLDDLALRDTERQRALALDAGKHSDLVFVFAGFGCMRHPVCHEFFSTICRNA